jgi:sugar/nucleoside kinase (ribokinase family)
MPIVRRRIFIDLADPAKRTDPDIRSAMATLRNLEAHADVTLGLNLAEAVRIDRALNSGAFASCRHPSSPTGPEVASAAEVLRNATGLSCVVIHPRSGAGASDSMTAAAWFDGPMVAKPRLSTGAGDHFNAGFALAQAAGLPLEECLAAGTATSGAYVRDAESPTLARLCEMLAALPEPQA